MASIDFFTNPEKFKDELNLLSTSRMPFGKYKGKLLCTLPEHYLVWFKQQGFPEGKLGGQLALLYELRLNGLMHLLSPQQQR